MIASPAGPTPRFRRPAGAFAAVFLALVVGFALPGRAEAPCGSTLCWIPRGNYAGLEFTTLVSPPGNPCVVAWTALSNGGLGVSKNCGEDFARLLFANAYDVTAKDTNIGYVAAGNLGIVKTRDTGTNWFPINAGLPPSPDGRSIFIHIAHPESVFCGLYGGGVYAGGPTVVGVDSAVTWTSLNAGLGDLTVRTLVRVRGGTFLLAGTESGIWRRANSTWTQVAPGVVVNAFVIDSGDSNRCYAATETGVYRSLSQGVSWFPSSTGLPAGVAINDIVRRTEGPQVLYVGTRGQGVYESVDYGANWHKFGPVLPGDNDVRAVLCTVGAAALDSASVFAGTRADGLYEAAYSTPAQPMTWGRLKATYRN
jgi:photosystem II stability/assembly factor-like uncharacterized protein